MTRRHLYEPANERAKPDLAYWAAVAALVVFDIVLALAIVLANKEAPL